MRCSTYGAFASSPFGVGIPPGELISCALLALPAGVRKSAFLFTVLPLTPFEPLGRGVFGTNPSSLHCIRPLSNSAVHGDLHVVHVPALCSWCWLRPLYIVSLLRLRLASAFSL
jgi:hypothetical protein